MLTRKIQNRLNALAERFRFSINLPVGQFQINQFQEGMVALDADIKAAEAHLKDLRQYRDDLRKQYFTALKNKVR